MIEALLQPQAPFSFRPPMPLALMDSSSDIVHPSAPLPMSVAEVDALLARNHMARITHALGGGNRRTRRAPYVSGTGVLYVPATSCPLLLAESTPRRLDCDVSELTGLSHWRYVWTSGPAEPLHPTGSASEREEWYYGVELLKRVMFELGTVQELAFANFGIVRLTVESKAGVHLPLE